MNQFKNLCIIYLSGGRAWLIWCKAKLLFMNSQTIKARLSNRWQHFLVSESLAINATNFELPHSINFASPKFLKPIAFSKAVFRNSYTDLGKGSLLFCSKTFFNSVTWCHPRSPLKADPNSIVISHQKSSDHKDRELEHRKYSANFLKPQFPDSAIRLYRALSL